MNQKNQELLLPKRSASLLIKELLLPLKNVIHEVGRRHLAVTNKTLYSFIRLQILRREKDFALPNSKLCTYISEKIP